MKSEGKMSAGRLGLYTGSDDMMSGICQLAGCSVLFLLTAYERYSKREGR